jgi:hypothetical protein
LLLALLVRRTSSAPPRALLAALAGRKNPLPIDSGSELPIPFTVKVVRIALASLGDRQGS